MKPEIEIRFQRWKLRFRFRLVHCIDPCSIECNCACFVLEVLIQFSQNFAPLSKCIGMCKWVKVKVVVTRPVYEENGIRQIRSTCLNSSFCLNYTTTFLSSTGYFIFTIFLCYLVINSSIRITNFTWETRLKRIKQLYGLNGQHRAMPLMCSQNITQHIP